MIEKFRLTFLRSVRRLSVPLPKVLNVGKETGFEPNQRETGGTMKERPSLREGHRRNRELGAADRNRPYDKESNSPRLRPQKEKKRCAAFFVSEQLSILAHSAAALGVDLAS